MKKRILVVPSDKHGVGFFRSINPHITLEKLYGKDFHIDIDFSPNLNDEEFLKQYDLIHYHRTLGAYDNMENLLNRLDELNIKTVMDIDDYWTPGKDHPAHYMIKHNGLDKKILNNIKIARNITTTTEIFAKEIRKYNKNVHVIPNGIDLDENQFKPTKTKKGKIRIGWLGGSSHQNDLKMLTGLTNMLKSAKLMDNVQFVLCGFDLSGTRSYRDQNGEVKERPIKPHESVWYEYEKIFTDNYKLIEDEEYKRYLLGFTEEEYPNVEKQPYRRVWTKPVNSYANNYNLFDISLAPLKNNIFNSAKSQLKVIEAAFHEKAIVAQDFGPYQIDLKNAIIKGTKENPNGINPEGNSILIGDSKSVKSWFKAIKKLIQNPDLLKMIKKNLKKDIKKKYSLQELSKNRKKVYNDIINGK